MADAPKSTRKPLRALIIEDSEFDAKVMVQALRTGGYDVQWRRVETGSGMEAALVAQAWDVILADYNVPEFNALQALRVLQLAGLDVPFLIVSGGIGEDVAVDAMKAGAHDYVMKGNPARLLPAVDRELGDAEVRRRRREAEAKLRDSELRYRSLWETSPDALLFCDAAGVIGFANPAAEVVFGHPMALLTGLDLSRLEPVGEPGGLRCALAAAKAEARGLPAITAAGESADPATAAALPGGGPKLPVEGPALRQDGSEILVEVTSSRLDLPDQPWFVLFARDITEKRRIEADLRAKEEQMRAAREIQQRLFPKAAPLVLGYDIAGTSVPADATGGDYYDFLSMKDGCLGLVVADVSGHGLGPSLLMVETRALLRVVARSRSDPGEILVRANRVIAEDVGLDYVTVLLVRLDPRTGEVIHASAGHPPGLVFGADGQVKMQLRRTGRPLGFVKGPAQVSAPPLFLVPGDILLMYSDGILEAHRPDGPDGVGEPFGAGRIAETVRQHAHLSAEEIIQALCEAGKTYAAPVPLEDDLTLLVVKVL